ncbi:MAG: flagellar biosynthetic protein FliO [Caulobacteraceae bacterium]
MFLLLKAVFALAATLGLFGIGVWGARRWGPKSLFNLRPVGGGERRLAVLESLTLDPSRRLLLVRVDRQERLVLLGEGQVLAPIDPGPIDSERAA